MSRRAPLPGASELFRRTTRPSPGPSAAGDGARNQAGANGNGANGNGADENGADENGADGAGVDGSARPDTPGEDLAGADTDPGADRGSSGGDAPGGDENRRWARAAPRKGSGRQRHDAKITVYVSGDELLAMEHARLTLRGSHDLVVDRGRLVREAVAVLLADFEEHGEGSVLVHRLRGAEEHTDGDPGGSGETAP